MPTELPPLPLCSSSFPALRKEGAVYVDKTVQIASICEPVGVQIFLTRPPRFGKTLLLSTIETLFRSGVRDFKGLAIEKLWQETETYRVVRLDFSDVSDFADYPGFVRLFEKALIDRFSAAGFVYHAGLTDLITQIGRWMENQPDASIVVLIDDCDAPLTACLHRPDVFNDVQLLLSRFFQKMKTRSGCLRFFFMTGAAKFCNTGIFTGFNSLEDISLQTNCGTLLGFTEEEIRTNFAPYLDRAAKVLGLAKPSLIEKLRENYGGYCFDRRALSRVYRPWSVLKFLEQPDEGFKSHWRLSGALLTAWPGLDNPADGSQTWLVPINHLQNSLLTLEPDPLTQLYEAGCLTIRSAEDGYAVLGFPNKEAASSMAQL